jgi:acetyltransferase
MIAPMSMQSSPDLHELVLPTGERAALRPIAPEDFAIETAFVQGLSFETGYKRLFSARKPGPEEIWRWTHVDQRCEVARIAVVRRAEGEVMLGVARYVREDCGDDAEFAVVIADAAKRLGLGRALLQSLVDEARRAGLRSLWGTTFSTNAGMLALARGFAFRAGREPGDASLTRLTLALA